MEAGISNPTIQVWGHQSCDGPGKDPGFAQEPGGPESDGSKNCREPEASSSRGDTVYMEVREGIQTTTEGE
jgi:hypothetical protein